MHLRSLMVYALLAAMISNIAADNGSTDNDIMPIHVIQGDGQISPLIGNIVAIEAIMIGDFQGKSKLNGFYLQEEDRDADGIGETSEGIFVYDSRNLGKKANVSNGDLLQIIGMVNELNGMTQINLSEVRKLKHSDKSGSVAATTITLPIDAEQLERYEGMLVELPQEFAITGNKNSDLYGEKTISPRERLLNPTSMAKPGASAIAIQKLNQRSRIVLDDGSKQKCPKLNPFQKTLRCGDSVLGIRGILSFDFGEYRIHPLSIQRISALNSRPDEPESVGGTVKAASFNLENYFNGNGMGSGFPGSKDKGAKSIEEFKRQRLKIIDAITDMQADVIGLMEVENDGYGELSAIRDLLDGLNNYEDKDENANYSFIDPGLEKLGNGSDICVGIIYNSSKVTPAGSAATISTGAFSLNKNRQPLAQTFEEISSKERFTIVVNHFKSKSTPDSVENIEIENLDNGDGQAYWNGIRTKAANELIAWILNDPTNSGDPDFLIIGDLNSYVFEDPITAFNDAGYEDLIAAYVGPEAYTLSFEDQWGYVDHALANNNMAEQVSCATIWHINADEMKAFSYKGRWYSPDKYRCSDHDPVIIVLNLSSSIKPT